MGTQCLIITFLNHLLIVTTRCFGFGDTVQYITWWSN